MSGLSYYCFTPTSRSRVMHITVHVHINHVSQAIRFKPRITLNTQHMLKTIRKYSLDPIGNHKITRISLSTMKRFLTQLPNKVYVSSANMTHYQKGLSSQVFNVNIFRARMSIMYRLMLFSDRITHNLNNLLFSASSIWTTLAALCILIKLDLK